MASTAIFAVVWGCHSIPDYKVVKLPMPFLQFEVGDKIEWARTQDVVRFKSGGTILWLPDCRSCSTSRISFKGWRRTIEQEEFIVASATDSELMTDVLGNGFDRSRVRVNAQAPKIRGKVPDILMVVQFDQNQRITNVMFDPEEIERRMR